jgi:hypothetical protein
MDARQGITLLTAICALIGTLVIIQLWLVAASLEALLGNENNALIPATIASAALFLLNGSLLLYVRNFDRKLQSYEHRKRQ